MPVVQKSLFTYQTFDNVCPGAQEVQTTLSWLGDLVLYLGGPIFAAGPSDFPCRNNKKQTVFHRIQNKFLSKEDP